MTTAEMRAAVEAAWEWAQIRPAEPYEGCKQGKWVARLPLLPFSQTCFENEDEAIEAAYLFTEARKEEIRQLDVDIDRIQCVVNIASDMWQLINDAYGGNMVVGNVRLLCSNLRTLQRLQSIRADLTRGMKGEGKDFCRQQPRIVVS